MDARAGVLRAALTLFAAKGYDGVGVQEVAEAAGVAKPTLYHFFGSKHGLLEALFAAFATRLDDAVRDTSDYARNLPLTLDRIVAAYIDFATREPLFYRLQLALYFSPRDNGDHHVAPPHHAYPQSFLAELFFHAALPHGHT